MQGTELRSSAFVTHRTLCASAAAAAMAMVAACSANIGNGNGNTPQASMDHAKQDLASTKQSGREVKIAMLLPLAGMGPTAAVAKSLKQAGEMALFERDNPSIRLMVKNDGGTPEGARAAAEQAVRDGAEIILGPLFARSVTAAAPAARQANVPMVAFSNDTRVAGNGVYLMSFLPGPEVERIVSYAASRGKRRFTALIPSDAYGDSVEPAFRAVVQRSGGTIAHIGRYTTGANAMLEPVKQLSAAIKDAENSGNPVDALFLPAGQDTLPQLASLIAYNGIDPRRVQILGTGNWDYPNVGREQSLAGGWFPSPDPRAWQDFSSKFSHNFGSAPPRVASLAYDAVSFAVALSSAAPGQRFTATTLTNPRGFSGVDGVVMFSANGLALRNLAIVEIQPNGNNVIDAASQYAVSQADRGAGDGTSLDSPPARSAPHASRSRAFAPPVTGSVRVPLPQD